ncbi:phosphatase PAP2 family protein [Streptomyces sp. NPDC057702]|uniref:phosphatase PAP2 family protein n=1 Tax=unclassified Streptomyces TaxID=2593676 RepID=UPI0036BF29CE
MPHTAPRTGTPQRTQPRWWAELPLIAVVYAAYSAGRLLARGSVSSAVDHGLGILEFEQTLGIDFETPLNDLFTRHASLGIPADFAYASLHYIVTPAILIWLWKRRPTQYRVMRTWLMLSTLIGLIGFITLPTCPPRLLDAGHGFVDTMAQYGEYGWWGGEASAPRGLGGLTNQYAAMPSLHVGWSLWCGIALFRHGRSVWAKAAGIAYPLLTTIIVMGTANHYFLDAAAGAAVMGVGFLLARPALRLTDRVLARASGRGVAGAAAPMAAGSEPAAGQAVGGQTAHGAAGGSGAGTTAGAGAPSGASGGQDEPDPEVSAPSVSGGCETSAGEHIPQQPKRDADRSATAPADGAAAAAR